MTEARHAHMMWFSASNRAAQEMHLRDSHQIYPALNDTAAIREEKHAWQHDPRSASAGLGLCAKRVNRAIRLLTWVQEDVDLSGHMELAAAIRAYLSHE